MKEIEKLYDLYSKDVYRFIYSLSFDEEIAKDIMQITFLECIKSIKNFKGNCSEKTWLLAIAKNQYYTYLKKHPKTQSIYESNLEQVEDFNQNNLEEYNEVLKAIHSLKEPQRQIMILTPARPSAGRNIILIPMEYVTVALRKSAENITISVTRVF